MATGTRAVARKLINFFVIMFDASSSCRQTVVIPAKFLYATSLRFPDRNANSQICIPLYTRVIRFPALRVSPASRKPPELVSARLILMDPNGSARS